MAKTRVILIPGDGIGPEVTAATLRVLETAGAQIEWEEHHAGTEALERCGQPLPDTLLDAVRDARVALKGPVTTPVGKGFRSVNVGIRKALDLYANLRPVESLEGVPGRYAGIDLVVVRENTEGLYSGIEHEVVPGVVESLKIITRHASTRIAEFAFRYAHRHGRRRITAVHKANIMKLSDGLFLECFHEVAARHPEIEVEERIVDNMAMQLVVRPEDYDVLLLENLYGDILSDLSAGLVGGLGVSPGANIGEECAVFEAVHGSAPDIAGQGVANPTALIRSAVLLLEHIEQGAAAARIRAALRQVLVRPEQRTRDLGGDADTSGYTDALVAAIEAGG